MNSEKSFFNSKISRVMGYIFTIVGVIELVLSLVNRGNYWLSTFEHLSIGVALLISSNEFKNKIVYYLLLPLCIVCVFCMITGWLL